MVEYERKKLYEEVWNEPVSTVAKRYGVSDVAIHKICKSMDIPVPPRGYWAKIRAGQKVKKEPLPKTDKRTTVTRYFSIERKPPAPEPELMDILSEEEYQKLMEAADQNKKTLTDKLLAMENNKDVPKTKRSIYRTCLEWLKRDKK